MPAKPGSRIGNPAVNAREGEGQLALCFRFPQSGDRGFAISFQRGLHGGAVRVGGVDRLVGRRSMETAGRGGRWLVAAEDAGLFKTAVGFAIAGGEGQGPARLAHGLGVAAGVDAWNAKGATEKKNRGLRSPSVVPLRGYCRIGYYTMMRPDCNLHLRWDEVMLDAKNLTGWYKLDQHKNVNKGIKAEGPLAEELIRAETGNTLCVWSRVRAKNRSRKTRPCE